MSGLNQDALKMSAKAADASPATSEVGTLLCATRMRLGRDLQHIAKILHIRYNYLVAMEDGRYEDLPGQAYAIGFVRAYADHLGLDGDEIVRRYKEETSGLKNRPVFEFPLTPPDSGVPSGALILVAILLGMIVYGAWYAIAGSDRGNIEVVQAVPERLTTEVAPPPAEGAAPQADISAEEDSEAIAAAAPRDPSVAGEAGPGEPEAGVVAPAISPPTQIAAVPAPPVSTDVVELRAKSDVWITLKSQGKTDRTQMLKKGEVLRAPEGGSGMTLVTAKPSDLEILVNGTVMPQGDAGLFAKGVPLDPAQFKGAPAAPATPPQQKTPTANPSGAQ